MTEHDRARMVEELERSNADLRRLVAVDALTGLWTRRHIDGELTRMCGFARRRHEPVSLLLVRVEDLAGVAERHGPAVADGARRHVAGCLRETARREDLVGRWDDDEFLVVLVAISEEGAERLSRRIGRILASRPFETDDGPVELPVAVGTATGSGADPDALLREARTVLDRRADNGQPMRRSTPAQ